MNYSYLNLVSLILGFIAWMLPIVNLIKYNNHEHKNWMIFSIASVGACASSLCFQIIYNSHLVKTEDWSALLDTSGNMAWVCTFLLMVTIALNIVTIVVYRKKGRV